MAEKFEDIPPWRKDHFIEAYKFSSQYFASFANILFLINGGAIVGIVSFLGNVLARTGFKEVASMKAFSVAIIGFGVGIFFCALGAMSAYFVQRRYIVDLVRTFNTNDYEKVVDMFKLATRKKRIGSRQFEYSIVYVVLGLYGASCSAFLVGCYFAVVGLWKLA